MFCRYCGRKIEGQKSFCPYCGKKLVQLSSDSSDPSAKKNTTKKEKPRKYYGPVLVWFVFVILLAIGIVGTLAYFDILEIPIVSDVVDMLRESEPEKTMTEPDHRDDTAEIPETTPLETEETRETEGTVAPEATDPTEVPETTHVHTWEEATYSAPCTCSGCGLTSGLSLGTPLINCTVIDDSNSSKGTDIITGTQTDEAGVEYEDAATFWVNAGSGYVNEEHIVYKLSGTYDELNGLIALAEKSAPGAAVRFYIYGDNELLYTSEYISGTESREVKINVSGVQELCIKCETDETCHGYGILAAMLFVS